MVILTIFYALFFIQLIKSFLEEGAAIYKDPKIWLHVISLGFVTYLLNS